MTTYIKGTFPVRFRRDGKDGVGINSVNTYYALGDSLTVSPPDSKYIYDTLTDVVISTNSGSYVWSGDKIMYTNGNASLTGKYCIGKCSELASVTEQYGTSSSATDEPTSWYDSYPTSLSSGIYIWTRDKIVWKNNGTTYSTAKKAGYIAKDGELGFGIVVSLTRNQYTEEELNEYFEVGHQEFWSLNSESEKNGCRIGDIFMVSGIAKNTKSLHAAYFRCTDNTKPKRLDGISIRHDIIEKGDRGEDAYSYKLRSNISAIPLDNNGMPVDSAKSLTLTGNIFKGSSSISVSTSYTIKAIITWNGTASATKTSSNGSLTVDLSTYKNIVKVACSFLYGSTVLDSFDILPIKAGAAGVSYFPNMCGVWDGANVTYKWTNGSRDMVTFYVGSTPYLFAVKTAGTTIKADVKNATPDKDSRWEKADSPFSMLFANFVYTDNASVAGFVWAEEQMMSSSFTGSGSKTTPDTANIYMNGKDGIFRALRAEIKGKIIAKSGTLDNCTINETCKITKIEAVKGKIGGFDINKESLGTTSATNTDGVFLNSEVVIFNDTSNRQAFLGVSSVLGTPILCRLTDIKSDTLPKYGIVFNIDNSSSGYNMAFAGKGHGVLNGMVEGFMLNDFTPSSSYNTISPQKGNYVIVKGSYTTVYLPTLSECRQSLGLSTTSSTKFAMMMTILCAGSRTTQFTLYGYRSSSYGANCPHLRDNNYDDLTDGINMGAGDVVHVLITYDGSNFDAYLISRGY